MPEYLKGEKYLTDFDPQDYFQTYYDPTKQSPEIYEYYVKFLFESMRDILALVPDGEKMIDIGNGPCIHGLAVASRKFKKLYVADYVEANRKAVVEWLSITKNSIDWSPMLKIAAEMEGIRPGQLEARIRRNLRKVLPCDVKKPEVLEDDALKDFDYIQSMLCLEGARDDFDGYCQSLGYLANLTKSEGFIMLSGLINEDNYDVGAKKFNSVVLNRPKIEKAAAMNDLKLVEWKILDVPDEDGGTPGATEAKGMFFVLLQKNN